MLPPTSGLQPPTAARWLLWIVLLVAAGLRLGALSKPLYVDEIVTVTVASQPLADMGDVMRQIDASPALYPLLLHAWLAVAGSDEWARALSALFGIAAVYLVYLLGRQCFGERAGLAAAFVAAIAPAHVHYAQYVRSYSLFSFLAALHLLLLIDWFRHRTITRARFLAFVAVTAAMFYTHYLSSLAVAAEAPYVALQLRERRAQVMQWMAAMAFAVLLFLPGAPLLWHNVAFDRIRNEMRPEAPPLLTLLPNLMGELSLGQRSLGFESPALRRATLASGVVVFGVLLIEGLATGWRRDWRLTLLLVSFAFLPIAVYALSGRKLVAVRFFVPFMAGYLVLLGLGLERLRRPLRLAAGALLVAICAIPLAHFYRNFEWSYDHRAVAEAIDRRLEPGDVLLFVHPYEILYYRRYLGSDVPMEGLIFTALEDQGVYVIKPPALQMEVAQRRVREAARSHDRLWVIGQSTKSFASDPADEARFLSWMDGRFRRLDDLSPLTAGDPKILLYSAEARDPDRDGTGF